MTGTTFDNNSKIRKRCFRFFLTFWFSKKKLKQKNQTKMFIKKTSVVGLRNRRQKATQRHERFISNQLFWSPNLTHVGLSHQSNVTRLQLHVSIASSHNQWFLCLRVNNASSFQEVSLCACECRFKPPLEVPLAARRRGNKHTVACRVMVDLRMTKKKLQSMVSKLIKQQATARSKVDVDMCGWRLVLNTTSSPV